MDALRALMGVVVGPDGGEEGPNVCAPHSCPHHPRPLRQHQGPCPEAKQQVPSMDEDEDDDGQDPTLIPALTSTSKCRSLLCPSTQDAICFYSNLSMLCSSIVCRH